MMLIDVFILLQKGNKNIWYSLFSYYEYKKYLIRIKRNDKILSNSSKSEKAADWTLIAFKEPTIKYTNNKLLENKIHEKNVVD